MNLPYVSYSYEISAWRSSQHRPVRSVSNNLVPGYDCDFEQDLCGWTNSKDNSIDWFREQPESNSFAGIIGPSTDHTYGNATGYYVTTRITFLNTGFQDVDISGLISPLLPTGLAGSMCADWWYMMHGTDETELSLYLIRNDNFSSPKASWRRYGDQGRHWQHGQIQIDPGMNVTRVFYEVVSLFGIRSEVSLDDLTLIDGPCIQPDFYSISCTFEEEHICGYSSDPTGQLAWTRGKGSSSFGATGPSEGIDFKIKFELHLYILLFRSHVGYS